MERTGQYPRLVTLAASVIVIAALYLAKGVLIPFALAMLVSFLLAPLVLRLQRWRVNRVVAVVTAVLLVFVVSSAASWLVVSQVKDVTTRMSEYRQNIHDRVATLRGLVGKPVQSATSIVKDLGAELESEVAPGPKTTPIQPVRIVEPPLGDFQALRQAVEPILGSLMTAAMVLVFSFVMLLQRDTLGDRVIRMAGPGKILVSTRALEEAAKKVSGYLWRLLVLNGLHGLAVGIGLSIIGVPNALLWGLLSAILRFIPYVGPWIAAACPILVSLAIFQGWTQPMLTVGLFVLLELISNNLLEPWFYGKGTGVSPLAILVSALFWAWLWGPIGLVLSTPLTVCLVVMGKYVPQFQFLYLLFGDTPALSPPARLYQRLIAGDQDQAWLVLRTEAEQTSLHEVYDTVVLPALSMAEHDRQRGTLDVQAEARIGETLKLLLEENGDLRAVTGAKSEASAAPGAVGSLRVLCIPARGEADTVAAILLRQVLEGDGAQVAVASNAELAGATLELLEGGRVDVVCISAVPPSRFVHVRYLCRRITGRFPDLPIVVGMWTVELETQEVADRLPLLAGVHVVATLGEARAQVRRLADTLRSRRDAGRTTVVAQTG